MTTSKIPQVPNVHELRMDGLPTDGEKGGLEPVETGSTPPDAETEPINDVTAAPPLTRKRAGRGGPDVPQHRRLGHPRPLGGLPPRAKPRC